MPHYWELAKGIRIKKGCDQSRPCEHLVFINGQFKWLFGIEIYELCKFERVEIPDHFRHYDRHLAEVYPRIPKNALLCIIL